MAGQGGRPPKRGASLRYMDRYVTITQGEVFYMTERCRLLKDSKGGPPETPL
jgi:hypothetical protein